MGRTVHEVGSERCNFGRRRATDFKGNKIIKLPRARNIGEEGDIEVSKGEWCKIFDNYTKRNTDE